METALDVHAEYHNRLDALPTGKRAEVERMMNLATGYVWGWQDGKNEESNSDVSWNFGHAYGIHAAKYAAEEIGMCTNPADAFRNWNEYGTVVLAD